MKRHEDVSAIDATGQRLAAAHGACANLFRELLEDEDVVRAIKLGDKHDPGRNLAQRVCAALVEWTASSQAAVFALGGDAMRARLCGRHVLGKGSCIMVAGHVTSPCRPAKS